MASAEFFDIFGIVAFIVILYIGVRTYKKKKTKRWVSYLLIAIGLLGLLVDSYIVFNTYVFG